MFRRKASPDVNDDDIDLMGEHEQREYISRMQEENQKQNEFHRKIFVVFCLVFAMVKFYGAVSQMLFPFNMLMHMYLYGIASTSTVVVSEIISGVSFLGTFYFLYEQEKVDDPSTPINWKNWTLDTKRRYIILLTVGIVGVLQMVSWNFVLGAPYLHSFWFGGGNVLFAFMCWFVRTSMEETDIAIAGLYKYITPHKTV